jgi:hypothetical protein
MDREQILRALRDDLEAARQRCDDASERLDDTIRWAPSGIPNPDDPERIRASNEYRHAR